MTNRAVTKEKNNHKNFASSKRYEERFLVHTMLTQCLTTAGSVVPSAAFTAAAGAASSSVNGTG